MQLTLTILFLRQVSQLGQALGNYMFLLLRRFLRTHPTSRADKRCTDFNVSATATVNLA
jgi:hypothetical protein